MKKTLLFLAVVLMGMSMMAQTTYTKITSATELEAGENYLIVGYDEALGYCAMSYQKSANRHAIQVTEGGGTITLVPALDPSSQTDAYQITLGGSAGAWTLFDAVKGGYLYAASSSANQLKTQTANTDNGLWAIDFGGDGTAIVTAQGTNTRNVMRFNENSANGDPLFNCYLPTSTAGVAVMFYKEGGGTIYPEPSNYPTNFAGGVNITQANLTWTASAGTQPAAGYLVLGTRGTIELPVDGTPVANDTDPSDGSVAFNTTGTSAHFNPLPASSTWTFAIFPYTNSGANIDYKTDGTAPTVTLTAYDINTLMVSNFGAGLDPFTAYDVEGEQHWGVGAYQGMPYAFMNGYASGSNHANEDWLITPDLLNGNTYEEINVYFKNAYKFAGNHLQVFIAEEFDGISDPNEFFETEITDMFQWSEGEFAWVDTHADINTAGKSHLYLAFKYTCTASAASNWEIAEFVVYSGYDAVAENEAVGFNLYPNPAENSINVVAETPAEVQIMDMAGRTVMTVNAVEGVNAISVADLESGVYFVRMNGAVVKFIKK